MPRQLVDIVPERTCGGVSGRGEGDCTHPCGWLLSNPRRPQWSKNVEEDEFLLSLSWDIRLLLPFDICAPGSQALGLRLDHCAVEPPGSQACVSGLQLCPGTPGPPAYRRQSLGRRSGYNRVSQSLCLCTCVHPLGSVSRENSG